MNMIYSSTQPQGMFIIHKMTFQTNLLTGHVIGQCVGAIGVCSIIIRGIPNQNNIKLITDNSQ